MNILLAHMYIHMYMPGTKARKGQALELLELELLTDGCEPPSMLLQEQQVQGLERWHSS